MKKANNHLMNDSDFQVKKCSYPSCENTIPANGEMDLCEVCRSLSLRNSVTILLDPTAPINDRRDMVFHTMIHHMRPEEILNAVQKIEWIYLELQKQLKSHQLETYRREKFTEALGEVSKEREKTKTPKSAKQRLTKEEKNKKKLESLFGKGVDVKQIMGDDKLDTDF